MVFVVVAYVAFNFATMLKDAEYGETWQKTGLDVLFGLPISIFNLAKRIFSKKPAVPAPK